MNHAKKKSIGVAGLLLVLTLLVTACAAGQQEVTKAASQEQATHANVTLSHVPRGTSDVTWDAASKTLAVKIMLTGLAPTSIHPGYIHAGNCNSNGETVYAINPVMAGTNGVGSSETTISGVEAGIPQSGWHINIHNGPTLESDLEQVVIACGEVGNSNASNSGNQSAHLTFAGTADHSQAASGNAQLSIADGKLTVQVALSGLAPNSTHMAHIHSGNCDAQGSVVYTLQSIVADANGEGTSTTVVDQVTSISSGGWYIAVHLGATMGELLTQTGNDLVTCGNVVVG